MMSLPGKAATQLLIICCLFTLSACVTQERKRATIEEIQRNIDEGIVADPSEMGTDAIPEDVSSALLPPISVQIPGIERAAPQQRFDVKVRSARARDFFMSLVEGTPYNMVVHPKVAGRISLDMKNVTVPEVMATVRSVYGYDFKQTAAGFQVFPNTIHTRIFKIDYLAVQRKGRSQIQTNPGQATQGTNRSSSSSGSSQPSRTGRTARSGSSIDTTTDTDFWKELKEALEMLMGGDEKDGRRVVVNPQSGLVMVRALPSELRTIEEYLEQTESIVQRQVVIEARILEVTLNDGFQAGINWGALQNDAGDIGILSMEQGEGANFLTESLATIGSIGSTTSTSSLASATGAFTLGISTANFNVFIDLLKSQGDVEVLSNPRVSTTNNQKAVIKVGSDEFFVTDVSTDVTTGTATTTNVDVELTPFFSGVSLDVTPQIGIDDDIVLHIHPTVTLVREQIKQIESERGNMTLPLAFSTVRESDSVIRANNGQIVVLGGLMQSTVYDTRTGLPILGDIPILDLIFSSKSTETRKTELVILLKPVVVDAVGSQWSELIHSSSERMKGLGEIVMPSEEARENQNGDTVE
jgi:MSHA biogenesis protein MshL